LKLLIVKLSSMGDVVHAMPALTDALAARPDLEVDWVVEEACTDMVGLHPGVRRIIPVAVRRWRSNAIASRTEFGVFRSNLRREAYDRIIDAQGLLKSAMVAVLAQGPRTGFCRRSAREPLASLVYDRRVTVARGLHAIDRLRHLFAQALGFEFDSGTLDYGFGSATPGASAREVLLLHGTTWPSKHWPESCWRELARLLAQAGFQPVLPAGDPAERARAERIGADFAAEIIDRPKLSVLAARMRACAGAVSVDTGLGHLAAALDLPLVGLFGPTDPGLTGPRGRHVEVLSDDSLPCIPCVRRDCRFVPGDARYPPCFGPMTPALVFSRLERRIRERREVSA